VLLGALHARACEGYSKASAACSRLEGAARARVRGLLPPTRAGCCGIWALLARAYEGHWSCLAYSNGAESALGGHPVGSGSEMIIVRWYAEGSANKTAPWLLLWLAHAAGSWSLRAR
jgi:hypothetical protein